MYAPPLQCSLKGGNDVASCLQWLSTACMLASGGSWLDAGGQGIPELHDAPTSYQYFSSYQWAISSLTMGSIDIVPRNSAVCQGAGGALEG